ncbi:hypothetical protein DOY81_009216, partial [Sarcophaga bullata]
VTKSKIIVEFLMEQFLSTLLLLLGLSCIIHPHQTRLFYKRMKQKLLSRFNNNNNKKTPKPSVWRKFPCYRAKKNKGVQVGRSLKYETDVTHVTIAVTQKTKQKERK